MTDLKTLVEQEMNRASTSPGLGDVARRRDRKRRNQRFAAGVVGIAVFVAAMWIVTSVKSLDRSDQVVVPAASATTEPPETEPAFVPPVPPDEWNGSALPPKGTALSTPAEGQQILEQSYGGAVLLGEQTVSCPSGCPNWYHTYRIVYADGRVLWWNNLRAADPEMSMRKSGNYVLEQRLTPEGVDLVRSGVDPDDVPASAWAVAKARPYAPSRYSVCFWANGVGDPSATPLVPAVELLPARAKTVLDGSDSDPLHAGCLLVTTRDARALYDILSEGGLHPAADLGGVTPGATVGAWLLRVAESTLGERVGIYLRPLWPDGDWHQLCCA